MQKKGSYFYQMQDTNLQEPLLGTTTAKSSNEKMVFSSEEMELLDIQNKEAGKKTSLILPKTEERNKVLTTTTTTTEILAPVKKKGKEPVGFF